VKRGRMTGHADLGRLDRVYRSKGLCPRPQKRWCVPIFTRIRAKRRAIPASACRRRRNGDEESRWCAGRGSRPRARPTTGSDRGSLRSRDLTLLVGPFHQSSLARTSRGSEKEGQPKAYTRKRGPPPISALRAG